MSDFCKMIDKMDNEDQNEKMVVNDKISKKTNDRELNEAVKIKDSINRNKFPCRFGEAMKKCFIQKFG